MTSFSLLAKKFGDGTFTQQDPRTIVWIPLALVGLFLLRGIGDFTQTYFMGYVGRRIVSQVRAEVFRRILMLPIGYFDRHASATLLSRLTFNTEQIGQATTDSIIVVVRSSLTITGSIAFLLWMNVRLTAHRPHHGPAGRLAGLDHQQPLPPLQPPHPGLDGRRHARRQGELRGAAPGEGLQRPGAHQPPVRCGQRSQPALEHAPDPDQGDLQPHGADGDRHGARRSCSRSPSPTPSTAA